MIAKKKVCKNCGLFVSLDEIKCPNCEKNQFIDKYKGKIVIFDETSYLASKIKMNNKGMYALKYR